ncbi:MAG TPA: Stk1 family PASTA domain-containing Ser/Thr kinase [Streptosporangiaceae bacterium]
MTQPRLLGGRYELDGIVGRGGMAEVFRARDIRLDRVVGVKTLRDDLARDQTFQARFRREAQSAASLNHPSIVAVYDTGEDMVGSTPVPYIVMEFVDGRTLRDLLRDDRRLLPERALEITDGVLRALDYSHRNGIVHRDIKPGNVMLTRNGEVKVMDFGIARAVADSQMTMTQTAQVIGTAQYLSPEQARGERVDARSDLYSTGCLLYELLTGRPPFTGDSPVAIAYQHVKEEPVPPSQVDPEVPPWADAIVLKAMRKDPADRYQSAGEMRNDIQRALSGAPIAAAMPPPAVYAAGTRRMGGAATQVAGRTAAIPPYEYGPSGYGPDGTGPDGPPRRHRAWPWVALATVVAVLVAVIVLLKFVGSGGNGIPIPNVVGQTRTLAEQTIRSDGFKVGSETAQASTTAPKDQVIGQNPVYGGNANRGSAINLTISSGPPAATTVSVPDVTGLTQQQATQKLEAAGFKVQVSSQTQQQAGSPPGTVVSQQPGGNTQAPKNSTVIITLTPSQVTVPDVTGDSQQQAQSILSGAPYNFNVSVQQVSGPGQPGTVQSTSPGPNANVAPGSNITIFVIQQASPPPSPSPSPNPSDSQGGGGGH